METVVFFIAGAIVLTGGVGVIAMRNPVHSALSLVMTLFGVAVLFIGMEAYFLAAVQVIVYAGAIVVLFLFVIMLVGVDRAEDLSSEPIIGQRQFAALAGAGLLVLAVVIGVAFSGDVTGTAAEPKHPIEFSQPAEGGGTIAPEDNTRQLARVLFTDYVFAFEITALLLTIAVVGAVVLARRPTGELEPMPEVERGWPLRAPVVEPVASDTDTDDDLDAADDPDSEEVSG